MKTRIQIILFLIIMTFGSVVTFTIGSMYQSQIEWHEKVEGLKDISSDEPSRLPIDDGATPEELERDLQMILSDCTPPKYKGFAYGLSYSNGTHYIDNNLCEWQKIEQYSNINIDCIPYISKWIGGEDIRNGTHKYDYNSCQWIRMASFDVTIYPLPDDLKNDFSGKYFDDNYPKCFSDKIDPAYGVIVANETHQFHPEICEWEIKNEN